MAKLSSCVSVIFSGPSAAPLTMSIYAPPGKDEAIQRLTYDESVVFGEEAVQLLEGLRYEYEISQPDLRLAEDSGSGVVFPSSNPKLAYTGTIVTGLHTGRLGLLVKDKYGSVLGTAALEIRPRKLGHREHYRQMLDEITEVCVDLAMDLRAPTHLKACPSPGKSSQTIHQRFAFLRTLIGSRQFKDALARIASHPHKRWETEEQDIDVRRSFRPNAKTMRTISRSSRRVPVPLSHPLSKLLPSVPERIPTSRNTQTEDTSENRFIKFILENFLAFLRSMDQRLEVIEASRAHKGLKRSEADHRLRTQIASLEGSLLYSLKSSFFHNLSRMSILPLGSPVLQRRAGYREVFHSWLKFDVAARLVWHAGEDVYGAGQRDIATLYEYWVFFKLLSIFAEYFRLSKPLSQTLIEETEDGFGVKLKAGEHLAFDATLNIHGRSLRVQFGYNRTFSSNRKRDQTGSWTERMRPDYTLSLWPSQIGDSEISADEAERQELIAHLHFDAKYRVDDIQEIFGKESGTLQADGEMPGASKYKPDDLLKMHAYRDAIRRTHGAYILYPGDTHKNWAEYCEILPGLGAFPLHPGSDNQALKTFLSKVVEHVSDRATQREQNDYHNFRIHKTRNAAGLFIPLQEFHNDTGERLPPPSDRFVLISTAISRPHFEWMKRENKYTLRIANSGDLSALQRRLITAHYIFICSPDFSPSNFFAELCSTGVRVQTAEAMSAAGYPAVQSDALYLVCDFNIAPELDLFVDKSCVPSEHEIISLSEFFSTYS
ncbi:DUF2357 domain-containing protein [Halopseudomonas pelagia]|uniref:DUF2357 domain-containing protein n=1 Tax=Halopseudomonas pelagia TaxID=553151 RepID=UPI00039AB8D3|nr:DUF2357 domain-containing protein [Halopseudomonas pelagia]